MEILNGRPVIPTWLFFFFFVRPNFSQQITSPWISLMNKRHLCLMRSKLMLNVAIYIIFIHVLQNCKWILLVTALLSPALVQLWNLENSQLVHPSHLVLRNYYFYSSILSSIWKSVVLVNIWLSQQKWEMAFSLALPNRISTSDLSYCLLAYCVINS